MPDLSTTAQASKLIELGNSSHSKKEYQNAINLYHKALQLDPQNYIGWNNLGTSLFAIKDFDKSQSAYTKAIEINPVFTDSLQSLGVLYRMQGHFDLALEMFNRALAIDSNRFRLHYDLGELYRELVQFDQAEVHFKTAIKIIPAHARAWGNLATIYKFQNRLILAKKALDKAIKLDPSLPHLHFNLAVILEELDLIVPSLTHLKKAHQLDPDFRDAANFLFLAKRKTCDWTDINRIETALDQKQFDSPFVSLLRHEDPEKNLIAARDISQKIHQSVPTGLFKFDSLKKPRKSKIKIGYFSRDFMNHPTGQLVASMFKFHDRKKFEIWAYAYGRGDNSSYRKQTLETVDHFVDLGDISNVAAAIKIYHDKIDILVDLSGHTSENRLAVCAMRPAPIQVSWIGFLGTIGSDFFDYMLVDKIVVPPNQARYYTEKLVYLPKCYQITNTFKISSKHYSRNDFGLPTDAFVFASFLAPQKIEPLVWQVWMQILIRTPHSVLWLWGKNKQVAKNLRRETKKAGVNPNRLHFFDKLPLDEHLQRARLADLALDTFVYQGANTVNCSLWAGVPLLTKMGNHFASRVSASFLIHAGLPRLITKTIQEYEDKAVYLSHHPQELKKCYKLLNHSTLKKNLFNIPGFIQDLEKKYLKMVDINQLKG